MINVNVELDWDAARQHVEKHKLPAVQAHQESLQRYLDERGMNEVRNYLSTDYFDACGYRHWHLNEDAQGYDREGAIEAMKRVMVAYIAQINIFGPLIAEEAFEDWRKGNHDT
jgi:isoleucyl-tRNA synthetase